MKKNGQETPWTLITHQIRMVCVLKFAQYTVPVQLRQYNITYKIQCLPYVSKFHERRSDIGKQQFGPSIRYCIPPQMRRVPIRSLLVNNVISKFCRPLQVLRAKLDSNMVSDIIDAIIVTSHVIRVTKILIRCEVMVVDTMEIFA